MPRSRRQVLALLRRVMASRGLAVLLVTHDLDVALAFCEELAVMYGGLIVERARGAATAGPASPARARAAGLPAGALARYSRLAGGRVAGRTRATPGGRSRRETGGCPLAGACSFQKASCFKELPPLTEVAPGHWLRCPPAAELPPPQFIDTL